MTNHSPRILVVEDDIEISSLLAKALKRHGFHAVIAAETKMARFVMAQESPDLIVLDLMLPGESGLELAEELREAGSNPPIIMLTALTELTDRLAGFAIGADDYLTKPFSTDELIARIEAVLRRAAYIPAASSRYILAFDGWNMDLQARQLIDPDGVEIVLTSVEFDVLGILCLKAGKVMSRDQIVQEVQGRKVEPYDRSVDTLVSRLRQKTSASLISTVRNGGYVFTRPVERVQK